jgi:hypothetical protein
MEQTDAKNNAFRMAPRHSGMSSTSGGMGKKLASAKEIQASQILDVFFLAKERVQS